MEELVIYIREAVDRKQENMRRRRRRDALRLQLVRVFELIAEYGTFGIRYIISSRDSFFCLHNIRCVSLFFNFFFEAKVYWNEIVNPYILHL